MIWRATPVYQHGDFHPGNLIYTPDHKIGVIDFNRWEVGDPYEEFYKLESFVIEVSVPYCIGQINAYFEDYDNFHQIIPKWYRYTKGPMYEALFPRATPHRDSKAKNMVKLEHE